MATVDELFDALMKSCKKPGDLIGESGLLKQLSRNSLERTGCDKNLLFKGVDSWKT